MTGPQSIKQPDLTLLHQESLSACAHGAVRESLVLVVGPVVCHAGLREAFLYLQLPGFLLCHQAAIPQHAAYSQLQHGRGRPYRDVGLVSIAIGHTAVHTFADMVIRLEKI